MSLRSIETYNTDTCGSWGIGQETMSANNTFCQVLERAIELKAKIILQTSKTDGVWYIKGTNNNKTYKNDDYKEWIYFLRKNSKFWLIHSVKFLAGRVLKVLK